MSGVCKKKRSWAATEGGVMEWNMVTGATPNDAPGKVLPFIFLMKIIMYRDRQS